MKSRVDNIINLIANEFHRIFDANVALLLFGSRANNTANQYSDIDLAVQHTQKLEGNKMRQFQDFIDNIPTLYSIDLLDVNDASLELKQQIKRNSILL
ncbi:MAG: nucleotidyltransferase domain-containing protein [Gammaproteobacteria bacterium]|nr:nucleotidyltransferase domain-containing protein [Gammaproteobacteria bacterium]